MKTAHMLVDGKYEACSKDAYKKGRNLSWDVSNPKASICKTCFNCYSKSGEYSNSCFDRPWLVDITVIEMSKINMMSV
jgi:hypothetical protein